MNGALLDRSWARVLGPGLGLLALLVSALGALTHAQVPPEALRPARIVRIDAALDAVVAPDAAIEKVAGGFGFVEGPVWSRREKALYFSDIPGNAIHKLQNGQDTIVRKDVFSGSGYPPDFHVGPNGLTFDTDGRLGDARGVRDGFKVDAAGNLLGSGPTGVWVISPEGKLLGRIETPETPANLAFGEDGKTLFVTARTSVYKVRLKAGGKTP